MGIFDKIKRSVFGVSFESKIMKTINTPIFIKDFKRESESISSLNQLLNNATNEETKKKIDNEINLQKYIQDALGKVYFELKNSQVPFYGLHNIRLEQGNSKANIDFIIVTNQFCYIINCKSHKGNIEIDNQGNFSRWVKKGDKSVKEGIYSPVEENRRIELILKSIACNNGLEKLPILSLTVFTNPKSTLNLKDCPKDLLDKVIKVDLLNAKLNDIALNVEQLVYEEVRAKEFAYILKDLDRSVSIDYSKKFKVSLNNEEMMKVEPKLDTISEDIKDCKETLVNALKAYRTSIATSNKIPPYYIFNNEEMGRILEVMPQSKEEFISIKGFGQVKFEKYGEEILNIIKNAANLEEE